MSDIQHLIELLKSDNPNKRYDACEELRVRVLKEPLPQEAIDALQLAISDTNPDVADAAQRALSLHTLPPDTMDDKRQEDTITNTLRYWPLIGFLAGLFPILCIIVTSFLTPLGILVFGTPGLLLSIGGAYLGRKGIVTTVIGAVVGSILWISYLMFTCAFCQ